MRVIPKIGEYDYKYINESIKKQIEDVKMCEIQLLQKDMLRSIDNVAKLVQTFNVKPEYIVIHTPFSALFIDSVYSNHDLRGKYIRMIQDILEYANASSIDIDFLTHANPSIMQFQCSDAIKFIEEILGYMNGSNVGMLIENSIISLNDNDDSERTEEYIFRCIDNPKLKFCLDLCHLQASENVLQKPMYLAAGVARNLKNIHFSATLDNDGYRNKRKTHGRMHNDIEHALEDIRYMHRKGINTELVNIILEISEDDYTNRPDLAYEIEIMNRINALNLV